VTWIVQTKQKSSRHWSTASVIYPTYDEAKQFGQAIEATQDVRYKNTETGKIVPRFPGQVV
jgi:hypothetical protein